MARSSGYNLGRLAGLGNCIWNLKKAIIRNLDKTEEALKELEDSDFMLHQQWIVISSLTRDNPDSPKLFHIRNEFVKAVKGMQEEERRICWSHIDCKLNDEERRLWKGEDAELDSLLKLAVVVVCVILASFTIYSETKFLGDESGYVILGSFLICIALLALIALVSYCYQMFKRRQAMKAPGLSFTV